MNAPTSTQPREELLRQLAREIRAEGGWLYSINQLHNLVGGGRLQLVEQVRALRAAATTGTTHEGQS